MATTVSMTPNPEFRTVEGLTNTTFDSNNITSGRMITEDGILQEWNDIRALKARADACCRDLLIWEAHVQIVRMNTNTRTSYAMSSSVGGVVVSSFDDNVRAGVMRRGLPYTATFPVKWDDSLYVRNLTAHRNLQDCNGYIREGGRRQEFGIVEYRCILDGEIGNLFCVNGGARTGFWKGAATTTAATGLRINWNNEWGNWVKNTAADGTVTLTDNRCLETFNVIRLYTQWVLKECADGSIIADNEDWA